MASYQKVIIVGHLGKDPELRSTPAGKQVTSFSVAVSEKRGQQDFTEWFNVAVWEKAAEPCAKYLKKGSLVLVEGSFRTEKWQDKSGLERTSLKLNAHKVQFLSTKNSDSKDSPDSEEAPF